MTPPPPCTNPRELVPGRETRRARGATATPPSPAGSEGRRRFPPCSSLRTRRAGIRYASHFPSDSRHDRGAVWRVSGLSVAPDWPESSLFLGFHPSELRGGEPRSGEHAPRSAARFAKGSSFLIRHAHRLAVEPPR